MSRTPPTRTHLPYQTCLRIDLSDSTSQRPGSCQQDVTHPVSALLFGCRRTDTSPNYTARPRQDVPPRRLTDKVNGSRHFAFLTVPSHPLVRSLEPPSRRSPCPHRSRGHPSLGSEPADSPQTYSRLKTGAEAGISLGLPVFPFSLRSSRDESPNGRTCHLRSIHYVVPSMGICGLSHLPVCEARKPAP
jgi:hypothetical protein